MAATNVQGKVVESSGATTLVTAGTGKVLVSGPAGWYGIVVESMDNGATYSPVTQEGPQCGPYTTEAQARAAVRQAADMRWWGWYGDGGKSRVK